MKTLLQLFYNYQLTGVKSGVFISLVFWQEYSLAGGVLVH